MGLLADLMCKEIETAPWWDVEFEIGRGSSDTQYYAARRTLFETFAPLEETSGPANRLLLCVR